MINTHKTIVKLTREQRKHLTGRINEIGRRQWDFKTLPDTKEIKGIRSKLESFDNKAEAELKKRRIELSKKCEKARELLNFSDPNKTLAFVKQLENEYK